MGLLLCCKINIRVTNIYKSKEIIVPKTNSSWKICLNFGAQRYDSNLMYVYWFGKLNQIQIEFLIYSKKYVIILL